MSTSNVRQGEESFLVSFNLTDLALVVAFSALKVLVTISMYIMLA